MNCYGVSIDYIGEAIMKTKMCKRILFDTYHAKKT